MNLFPCTNFIDAPVRKKVFSINQRRGGGGTRIGEKEILGVKELLSIPSAYCFIRVVFNDMLDTADLKNHNDKRSRTLKT